MSHRLIFSLLNSLSHVECGLRVGLVDREDLILPREELTLCKGKDNLPYIIKRSQVSVLQSPTRSVFRPVLVDEVTSTTSRRDQYCLPGVTSTGPIADQYWSHLPPRCAQRRDSPKEALLMPERSPLPQRLIPQAKRAKPPPLVRRGKRTTIGLCSDNYWYGDQTTIGFVCKPLLVCPPYQ